MHLPKLRKLRVALPVTLVAALAIGAGAYAAGTVPASSSDGVSETSASVWMNYSGGSPVTVTTLTLPPGSWVLSSEVSIVNFGPSDYARCRILANGSQVASGTTVVGNSGGSGSVGSSSLVAGRGLIGTAVSPVPISVALQCWHDNTNGASPYVDPGAVLWAHKANEIYGGQTR